MFLCEFIDKIRHHSVNFLLNPSLLTQCTSFCHSVTRGCSRGTSPRCRLREGTQMMPLLPHPCCIWSSSEPPSLRDKAEAAPHCLAIGADCWDSRSSRGLWVPRAGKTLQWLGGAGLLQLSFWGPVAKCCSCCVLHSFPTTGKWGLIQLGSYGWTTRTAPDMAKGVLTTLPLT